MAEIFECTLCDKKVKSKSALTLHVRTVHEGMKIKRRQTPRGNAPHHGGSRPPVDGWKDRFLEEFKETHLVTSACIAAGVSRAHFYKTRVKDEVFAAAYEDLLERDTELLERIATRRAAEGSDTLMIFLLKARRPEVYRENIHHDHSHVVTGHIGVGLINGHEPIEFEASKRREAAALLLEENPIDAEVVELDEDAA